MGTLRAGFSCKWAPQPNCDLGAGTPGSKEGVPARLNTGILSWLGAYKGVEEGEEGVEETCSVQVLEGSRLVETEL